MPPANKTSAPQRILVIDIGGTHIKFWLTGRSAWARHVLRAIRQLKSALQPDYVVLGGGKSKLLKQLPPGFVLGDNSKAYLGGCRLWHLPPRWRGFPP